MIDITITHYFQLDELISIATTYFSELFDPHALVNYPLGCPA